MAGAAAQCLRVSGTGNRAWFHAAVWDQLREAIAMYLPIDDLVAAIPAAEQRGTWGARGDVLSFELGAPWDHVIALALAIDTDQLAILATNEGVVIDSERPSVADALGDCRCAMCAMVRPEPACLATILAEQTTLRGRWLFARIHATPEVLVEVIRTANDGLSPVGRLAKRVGPACWDAVFSLLPSLSGTAKGLALQALATTARVELVPELRVALAGNDELAIIATELAGPELVADVAAILDRDAPDRLRHAVVQTLMRVDLVRPLSIDVRRRLEREASADTDAGKLATWLISRPRPS